jgi:hypothetical protein
MNMAELDQRTIEKLTTELERGHGCAFGDELAKIPTEQHVAAIKAMQEIHNQHVADETAFNNLEFRIREPSDSWFPKSPKLSIFIGKQYGILSRTVIKPLFAEDIDPATRKGPSRCED